MKNKKDSQADPANAAAMELMKRELIRAKVKRTIRTSFTLSPECLDSMDTMIAQRGLTYSELFDYAEVMIEAIKGIELKDSSASGFSSDKKKSKSFAIGTQALAKISENAKNRKIPRDRYVEMLMVSLRPIVLPDSGPFFESVACTSQYRTTPFRGSSSGSGRRPGIRTAGITSRTGSGY